MESGRAIIVSVLLLAGYASGIARQLMAPGKDFSPVDIVFMLLGSLLVFLWYRADSNLQRYRRSVGLNTAIVALALVALPYYFFRSRGFVRGLVATLLMLVVMVAYSLLQLAGEYTAHDIFQVGT